MKKLITIAVLFVMVAMLATTIVNAATSDTLQDELYAIGAKYGMKASEKVKMERYLADHPLTEAECNEILALANQADKVMQENGTTDVKSLPADVKAQLKSLANQAASIADVTLDFKSDGVNVYDENGTLLDSISADTLGKLAYTGNSVNVVLVVSSVAVVALAAGMIARKKFANA